MQRSTARQLFCVGRKVQRRRKMRCGEIDLGADSRCVEKTHAGKGRCEGHSAHASLGGLVPIRTFFANRRIHRTSLQIAAMEVFLQTSFLHRISIALYV